jgi:hypothetical protein
LSERHDRARARVVFFMLRTLTSASIARLPDEHAVIVLRVPNVRFRSARAPRSMPRQ